jgi:hypothetical protein
MSVVNEKTAFSWPVMVTIGACLVAVGGGMVRVEAIQRDADILRGRVDLLEHQQSADRGQLNAQVATLGEVKALVLDVRTELRDITRRRVASDGQR